MHVENQAGDVAKDEDGDDDHQDDGHAVLPHPPPLPPPPDGLIDLGVEEGDGDEGKDAEDKETGPVDVIRYIDLIHPKFFQYFIHPSLAHLYLQKNNCHSHIDI